MKIRYGETEGSRDDSPHAMVGDFLLFLKRWQEKKFKISIRTLDLSTIELLVDP